MLKACSACSGTVSNEALSCPHCGHPLVSAPSIPARGRAPIFTILAALGFFFCLFTPRIILVIPLFATVGFAVAALVRKERARAASIVVLVLAAGLLLLSQVGSSSGSRGGDSSALASAKVEDWNWAADAEFGTRGAIVWNVSVRNVTDKYIDTVRVELTTYDKSGKLIATDFTYVDAIPPGGTRSKESYADYYGTESNAQLQITDVRYAD